MATTITYNNSTISTIADNGTKTLDCAGKVMRGNVVVSTVLPVMSTQTVDDIFEEIVG